MKIAVIGTGIAGMVAAYKLNRDHAVTVYEANDYIGGHTNTIDVDLDGTCYPIDTGFIVFNDRTYPNYCALLDELEVDSQPTRMTFSVSCRETGLEYNGGTLNQVFAQRRNLARPSFLKMLQDILRFNRESRRILDDFTDERTLGDYLRDERYGEAFVRDYIIPMGAAIWSTDPALMFNFPARNFVRFFDHHGLLDLKNRPQWRTIVGGSKRYAEKLTAPFRDNIRLSTPVSQVRRFPHYVEIVDNRGHAEEFDAVFIAAHSDQALAMLDRPSETEHELLSAIQFQTNTAVLHTDAGMLPERRLAWAAWNYLRTRTDDARMSLTYNMNILQSINAPETFCVTLNRDDEIDSSRIIQRIQYAHPVFSTEAVAAQRRVSEINGANRTYYCGAYWGYGFHEDGVKSALTAITDFNRTTTSEELHLRRAS